MLQVQRMYVSDSDAISGNEMLWVSAIVMKCVGGGKLGASESG